MRDKSKGPDSRASLLLAIRSPTDDLAWKDFVDTYAPFVRWLCRNHVAPEIDPDDIVQDVFFKIAKSIHKFEYDPRKGRFRDWLRRVTRNCAITHYKRSRRVGLEPGIGGDGFPFEQQGDDDTAWVEMFGAAVMKTAVARIAAEFDREIWRVFELDWHEKRSAPEIAEALGRNVSWVHKKKFLIKNRLKQELDYLGNDSPSLQNAAQS